MDSLDRPEYTTEPTPAEDASLHDEEVSVPRQQDLRWPLVVALRDLGGAAHKNDIQERVTVLLELTEEQTAIEVPSGARTKLRDRLNWAGNELKHHQILTYPNPGHRELTPRGQTITESQLDALFRRTALTGPTTTSARGLAAVVEQFRRETGYPTARHEEQKRLREEWREKLLSEDVESLSDQNLAALLGNSQWGGSDYIGRPDLEPTALQADLFSKKRGELRRSIKYVCGGDGDFAKRLDEVDDHDVPMGDRGNSGFCKVPATFLCKFLAICHPDQFLPISAQGGLVGRIPMLKRLNLAAPRGNTPGERIVDANDRLQAHLAPHFDDDLYGMATFLYWLMKQAPLPDGETTTNGSPGPVSGGRPDLVEVAQELLVGPGLLEDIVSLLEDKGQVILYGPPGTGKTYLARELAKVLAPEESRRSLVQFHPSTSYEDFFEGYRPAEAAGDGDIRYELTPGPLARMAERASRDRARHVMVIDEINRGNLPRVLGELLFLLEYRDESVQTLYRPGAPFSLPENLWFIGTMNTADRSIALVDAALRRRFHFVPFFPDSGPIAGLLGRWLARENQPAWVGQLVDRINDELKDDLAGSHLLLGPSHFMKRYGSRPAEQRKQLRRIWEYNIEPFIEDQFFGDPDRIRHYRFAGVYARHGPMAGSEGTADADENAMPDASAGSSSDDATEDTVGEVGAP